MTYSYLDYNGFNDGAGRAHGRVATYQAGCRCDECRRVATENRRRYRPKNRRVLPAAEWLARARCKGSDPDLFFPAKGDTTAAREAKAVCAECPVRAECLLAGMDQHFGIWGGLSERQRRRMRGAG